MSLNTSFLDTRVIVICSIALLVGLVFGIYLLIGEWREHKKGEAEK